MSCLVVNTKGEDTVHRWTVARDTADPSGGADTGLWDGFCPGLAGLPVNAPTFHFCFLPCPRPLYQGSSKRLSSGCRSWFLDFFNAVVVGGAPSGPGLWLCVCPLCFAWLYSSSPRLSQPGDKINLKFHSLLATIDGQFLN